MTRAKIAFFGLALSGVVAIVILAGRPAPHRSNLDIERLQILAGSARDGRAEQSLRDEAGNGVVQAQLALGKLLIARPAHEQISEGVKWLRKLADTGNREALLALGKLYFHGMPGKTPDYAQAYTLLDKAAEQNDAAASYYLALMYKNGLGIAKDSASAARCLQKAVDGGASPASMFLLANMYLSGEGVSRDNKKARALIERAAELEYPEAAQMMAIGLREGSMGFERDEKRAAEQFLEASHALKHRPQDP